RGQLRVLREEQDRAPGSRGCPATRRHPPQADPGLNAVARFIHPVHMRWADMDAFGHINNTAYFAYLEQARVAMFFDRYEGFSSGTVIARHEIDYLYPVVYHPEPLRLELW